MKIKVISLNTAVSRREEFAKFNSHLDYEFYDALNGYNLSEDVYYNSDLITLPNVYSMGAIGSALTHLQLWEESISSDQPITIAEDDAIFRLDFNDMSQNIINSIEGEWDVIYWGWNFDGYTKLNFIPNYSHIIMAFNQTKLQQSIESFRSCKNPPALMSMVQFSGCLAYTISPNGAKKYKEKVFPLNSYVKYNYIPFLGGRFDEITCCGIDEAMSEVNALIDSKAYAPFPPLAVAENDHSASQTIVN